MRPLVATFILVIAVSSAPTSPTPTPLTPRQEKIRYFYGSADIDVVAADKIIEEEAAKLGVTADEHFKVCQGYSDSFKLTQNEGHELLKEAEEKFKILKLSLVFNRTEDIMPVLKDRTPKLHAALLRRLDVAKKFIARVDEESKNFLLRTAETIAEEIVVLSKTNFSISSTNIFDHLSKLGKPIKRIATDYAMLDQASKDDLDKTLCFTTSLRILDKDGKARKFVQKLTGIASQRQERILELFGDDIDAVAADEIIEDEAAELGVTAEEHFKVCEANLIKFNFTDEEREVYEQEGETFEMGTIVFNNTDEVMPMIKSRAPKTHAAVVKRLKYIETYIDRVDPASQKFIRKVGTVILDIIVGMNKNSTDESENAKENLANVVKAITQIVADHYALPDESKQNIERTTCIRTSFHIMNKKGRFTRMFLLVASFTGQLGFLEKQLERILDMS